MSGCSNFVYPFVKPESIPDAQPEFYLSTVRRTDPSLGYLTCPIFAKLLIGEQ